MLSTQFYKLILLLYHLVPAEALQCKWLTDIPIPDSLIAGVVIFILISMLNAAEALYRQVNESESCANLQPVKLLNYLSI